MAFSPAPPGLCRTSALSLSSPVLFSLPPPDLRQAAAAAAASSGVQLIRKAGEPVARQNCCCSSPRPALSSGHSNLQVSGISCKPFGLKRKMQQNRLHFRTVEAGGGPIVEDFQHHEQPVRTRVVEHVTLFKMKDSMTDEQEEEMLDNLWSLQYQIKNILCATIGRLVQKTPEGYTHALFSRFPSKQALEQYLESPILWRVAQDLVIPFYDGEISVDFEADVENDIETIFRRGDDFQEGLEHLMFFRFKDTVPPDTVDKFLKTASTLPEKYSDLIQLTIGTNFDTQSKQTFSHGLTARLPSEWAHEEYKQFLSSEPNWVEATELFETSQTLIANFLVSPVGKTVM